MKKPPSKGLLRFAHTIVFSISGLKSAWKYEESFRQECLMFFLLSPIACFVGINLIDYILLIGSLWLLLIVELINSAIETTIDRISLEKNELSKRAKDIASAAVMLNIFMCVLIWISIIFYRHF